MTQKELQEYRKIMRNAESIEYQIQKLQSQINKVTAIVNDMPRGGKSTDKSELICKLIDLQEQYKTEYSTAAEKLKTIETAIAELSDPQEQAVLRYKYILGLKENKICLKMNFEKTKIYEIHKSALKNLQKNKSISALCYNNLSFAAIILLNLAVLLCTLLLIENSGIDVP